MSRPNILFIQVDQLTAASLKSYGNGICHAPNLDRLAAEGIVFQDVYCNFPLCSPSRASMATGKLCSKIGAYDNAAELPSLGEELATSRNEVSNKDDVASRVWGYLGV